MTLTVQKTFVEVASYAPVPTPSITGSARGVLSGLSGRIVGTGRIIGTVSGSLRSLTSVFTTAIPNLQLWLTRDTGGSASDHVSALAAISGYSSSTQPITIAENNITLAKVTPDGLGNIYFDYDFSPGTHTIVASQGGATLSFTFTLRANKSTTAYLANLLHLLPDGAAWNKSSDSNMSTVLRPLMRQNTRINGRSLDVIGEAFPNLASETISAWESALGLSAGNLSLSQRQAACFAKFVSVGGASSNIFISYAAALGYTITIQNYPVFRCGISRVGLDIIAPESQAYAWQVTAPAASQSSLQAVFLANKPAYTNLTFVWT